ncbi:MAG: NAD(P)/FAD-dependent oxidoreductase [Bacillota bacterium]|nr:NAD(P)/FAD-dependent oxidoreductase [Bacillota bacterium]
MSNYDCIIIGAGPNGLTLGGYLAKAGQKVLILERRVEIGGGLQTEQVTLPGFLHSTHAVFHAMVDYAPVFADLELYEKYGLRFIRPEPVMAMPLKDGRSLCIYSDVERTCRSIAQFSQRDSESYREMFHRYKAYVDDFLAPATYVRAEPAFEHLLKMQSTQVGREIQDHTGRTPKEIVDELFENEHVKALILYAACKWGLDYNLEGVSFLVPLMINRAANYYQCIGGSHRLSHVLSKCVYDNGGMILGSQIIKRIIVENNVAKGVELENGTIYNANYVASTLNPYQTFFDYVGKENLEKDFITRINDYKWEDMSLFGVHMALEKRPHFKAADQNPDLDNAFIYLIGAETDEELIAHWDQVRAGKLTSGAFNCTFPSVNDPSQAPPGRHTGQISQHAPYNLAEGAQHWYRIRQEQAERLMSTLEEYVPNLRDDNLLWHYVSTPLDIENKFLDMVQGSIKQGAYHALQMGYNRPNEYCSRHVTPVKNLFLCGASSFSGGLVVFGPAYNGANAIAEEIGFEKWWKEPEIITKAVEKGLL